MDSCLEMSEANDNEIDILHVNDGKMSWLYIEPVRCARFVNSIMSVTR